MSALAALGFIETKGLLAAIEAADTMLKAADVCLLEKNLVGGGLVSISVSGEVSAVRAAVDAAVSSVRRINAASLVSEHVIARPVEELARIIAVQQTVANMPVCNNTNPADLTLANSLEQTSPRDEEPGTKQQQANAMPATEQNAGLQTAKVEQLAKTLKATVVVRHDISELKKMSLNRLRQLARSFGEHSLGSSFVDKAEKRALIEAITNGYRQIEE